MATKALLERITSDPRVLAGQPMLRGTRLSVAYILRLLASGATVNAPLGGRMHGTFCSPLAA